MILDTQIRFNVCKLPGIWLNEHRVFPIKSFQFTSKLYKPGQNKINLFANPSSLTGHISVNLQQIK